MDIIDIILAKSLTPQQLAAYVAQAQEATRIATAAAENIETITEQTNTNNQNSVTALNNVTAALNDITAAAGTEIKKLTIDKVVNTGNDSSTISLKTTYPDNSISEIANVTKYYKDIGNAEDGTMTQKAITDNFNTIEQSFTDTIGDLQSQIDEIKEETSGESASYIGTQYAGQIVVVGNDGYVTNGSVKEEDIVSALIKSGDYHLQDVVGLEIDYPNRTFIRVQDAKNKNQGTDFDEYKMYGGRRRCNVNDSGQIVAWYGDNNYKDDGSNGQVMVYQPKFYYLRSFNDVTGNIINKETLLLSYTATPGFKLHPLFKRPDGTELDYVLISAYEGSAQVGNSYLENDETFTVNSSKLSSIANVKPVSGAGKNFTVFDAEQIAQNRGADWHITNLAYESAMQMLQLVEYGMLNGQAALEEGISTIPNRVGENCASVTGSTATLGNATGAANNTVNNGTSYSEEGKRAISYRGVENPWGNIWRMIGGVDVVGNGDYNGGVPYVCTSFNYSATIDANNYKAIGFPVPSTTDWISAFGKGTEEFDWVYIPIQCTGANSAVPVGDNLWTTARLNGTNLAIAGGLWYYEQNNGMFYYGFDQPITQTYRSLSARLMYIPTVNSTYRSNIQSWENIMGE